MTYVCDYACRIHIHTYIQRSLQSSLATTILRGGALTPIYREWGTERSSYPPKVAPLVRGSQIYPSLTQFLSLDTTDIWGRAIPCCGRADLCILGYGAASSASTCHMPLAPPAQPWQPHLSPHIALGGKTTQWKTTAQHRTP